MQDTIIPLTKPGQAPGQVKRAFLTALPYTLPIFAGFWFLGIAYGVYMNVSGFSFWYPMLMALVIFGGSLEFIVVSILLSPFAPLQALVISLLVQARHLFYGISMLDKYRGWGWKTPYLIFGMCDESFSINYTVQIPEGVDKGWFMFFVTLLNQAYWVSGAALGGLLGSFIPFDTTGLDFALTAIMVVIFLEQWLKERQHYTALIGLGASALALYLFGPDNFMLPTMGAIILLLTGFRKPIQQRFDPPAKAGDAQ